MENVVRVRDGLAQIPPAMRAAVEALMTAAVDLEVAVAAVRRGVLAKEISRSGGY